LRLQDRQRIFLLHISQYRTNKVTPAKATVCFTATRAITQTRPQDQPLSAPEQESTVFLLIRTAFADPYR
jgi:hypothetical protein